MGQNSNKEAPRLRLTVLKLGAAAALVVTAFTSVSMLRSDLKAGAARTALETASAPQTDAAAREAALARAERALSEGLETGELADLAAELALMQSPPDLQTAEQRSHEALRASPARAQAWARLAYIDTLRNGRLGDQGNLYLAQSYLVEPFSPDDLRHWRLSFTFNYWRDIDARVRASAVREAQAFAHEQIERNWMNALADTLPAAPAAAIRDAIERGRGF